MRLCELESDYAILFSENRRVYLATLGLAADKICSGVVTPRALDNTLHEGGDVFPDTGCEAPPLLISNVVYRRMTPVLKRGVYMSCDHNPGNLLVHMGVMRLLPHPVVKLTVTDLPTINIPL